MNFKPDEKNIRSLLKSGCQFVIPRFQREYSWDKKNYQEFFEDMINNLTVRPMKSWSFMTHKLSRVCFM